MSIMTRSTLLPLSLLFAFCPVHAVSAAASPAAAVGSEPQSAPEPKFERVDASNARTSKSRVSLPEGMTLLNLDQMTREQRDMESRHLQTARILWQINWARQKGYRGLEKRLISANPTIAQLISAGEREDKGRASQAVPTGPICNITHLGCGIHEVSSASRGSMISINKWCGYKPATVADCDSMSAWSGHVDDSWGTVRVYPGKSNPGIDDDGVVARAECDNTFSETEYTSSDGANLYYSGKLASTRAYKIQDGTFWTTAANGSNCRG